MAYNNNNYYDYNHNGGGYHQDTYAMNDMTHHQQQPYPSYYEETKPIPSSSDGYYRNSQIGTEKYARRNNQRPGCCDRICCGCCTCCPRWCRWLLCIIFLIVVALGIVVGVLAAMFKTPSVNFNGVQGSPSIGLVGTAVNLNLSLGFTVTNPNIESVTFTTLTATANYHGDTTQLGAGTLHDVHISDHSVTTINFPFAISMDITNNATFSVLQKILNDCQTNTKIPLDYKVVATVTVIGIPISVPVSNTIQVPCPLDSSGLASLASSVESAVAGTLLGGSGGSSIGGLAGTIASALGGGNSVPTGVIPSGVSIPSSVPTDLSGLVGSG